MIANTAPTTIKPCFGDIASHPAIRNQGMTALKVERVYLTRYASYEEAKTTCSTTSAFTIAAVVTRRWAISARWSLSDEIRAVALYHLPTSSGTDHSLPSNAP